MTEVSTPARTKLATSKINLILPRRGVCGAIGYVRLILVVTLLMSVLISSWTSHLAHGQELIDRQYELKATYLVYFGYYVRWPEETRAELKDKFIIGVLGRDRFGGNLAASVEKTGKVGDKPIEVRHFKTVEDYEPCHILFLSQSASEGDESTIYERLAAVLKKVKDSNVLLVSETAGLAQRGVTINMVVDREENRLTLEINLDAAKRAGLTISSRLLALEQRGRVKIIRDNTRRN